MKKNKLFSYIFLSFFILIFSTSCQVINRYRLGDAVVNVNGHSLYQSDIEQITAGLSPEDSTRVINAYIKKWATEILEYDKARSKIGTDNDIETKVEAYRRTLYIHEYEQWLIGERMSQYISADSVQAIYDRYPERFTLKDNIIKGLFLVIHKDAPDQQNLIKWLANINDDNLENIEKYAYQYAGGYELFTDQWQNQSKILLYIPTSQEDFNSQLKHHSLIQVQDSTNTYLLQVTEKRLAGERMPLEYAQPDIERTILSLRQIQYLDQEKERIYNKAIEQNKIIFKQNDSHEE